MSEKGVSSYLPNDAIKSLMLAAYAPCQFFGMCREARWEPSSGHIPRGFLGATGALDDVEVIMVFSEPGHPHHGESYGEISDDPDRLLAASSAYAFQCFANSEDIFHQNARWFMSRLYPNLTFEEQLAKVWLTEGRLCAIDNEIGDVRDALCCKNYLINQIEVMPNASIVAFGGKAKHYLKVLGLDFIPAFALSPPGAHQKPARPSWERAISEIVEKRG